MARPRKPARFKKGNSETKQELKVREAQEKRLMGNTDNVQQVPEYLDELAKAYYTFLVTELETTGLLTNIDIPLLEETAICLSEMREMNHLLNTQGIIIQQIDRYGNEVTKENPAFGAKQKLLNQFKGLSTQLGMSPSSRAQLAGMKIQAKEAEADPVLNILKGGRAYASN